MYVYEGMLAESVVVEGHQGDRIPGYVARPLGAGPFPGMVVIHHLPGYDRATKEMVRTFAANGYLAVCPSLHHREAPDATPEASMAIVRELGGVPDEQCVADVAGAARLLRSFPSSSGKVGVIGHCSGGRHAYLAACTLAFDAAIDCYGGNVVMPPESLTPRQPVSPVDLTAKLSCPLLGLFGMEDANPSPDQVAETARALDAHGKSYEFHTFADAGHAFFAVDRPNYRVAAALEGWQKIWDFLGRNLG